MDAFKLAGKLVVQTSEGVKNIEKAVDTAKKAKEKIDSSCNKIGKSIQDAFKGDQVKKFGKSLDDLTQNIKGQQSKLDALKTKYKGLYLTHGKNSKEAKAVAKEITSLSKELKTNKSRLSEAEKAADKFDNSLEEVGNESQRTEGKMSGAFKKIGAAVIAAFSITAVVSFGQACVEAAASVKASNAQFKQTFGDLQDTASAAMGRVADSSGILQTRLQNIGTQIYAFAMSSGADSSEAMSLMETSLQATADAAAYYDRSLDDTAESLQSFLKGNFENDAALGVSCTETTRNAAAMELFGQKYNDLSEIQKQQTLLKMVTDAQELSGAMGQASRESDGWENVLGNLQEAWTQLQSKLGDETMTAIIPVIQSITDGLMGLSDNASEIGGIIGGVVSSIVGIADSIAPILPELGDAISGLVGNAAEIIEAFLPLLSGVVSLLISSVLPAITEIGSIVAPILSDLVSGLVEMLLPVLRQIITTVLPVIVQLLNMLLPAASQIITAILPVVLALITPLLSLLEPIISLLQPLLDIVVMLAGLLVELLSSALTPIIELVVQLISSVLPILTDTLTWISELITTLSPIISVVIGVISDIIVAFVNEFKVLIDGIVLFISGALDVIMGIVNFWIALFQGDWDAAGQALLQMLTGLRDMLLGLVEAALFSTISTITTNLDAIKNFFSSFGEKIGNFFSNLWEHVTTMTATRLSLLKDGIMNVFETVVNFVAGIVERLKGFFNFEFQIPGIKLPHFSLSPSGWDFSDLLEGTIPKLGIDWYANGGIMTKPTAFGINGSNVMIGGEAGAEAIAPIDTLKGYVAEAVASQNEELVKILEKILNAVVNADDELIWKMVTALESMQFTINNREFARLVRQVN